MQPHKRTKEIPLSSIKLVELFIDMLAHEHVVLPYDNAKRPPLSSVKWLSSLGKSSPQQGKQITVLRMAITYKTAFTSIKQAFYSDT